MWNIGMANFTGKENGHREAELRKGLKPIKGSKINQSWWRALSGKTKNKYTPRDINEFQSTLQQNHEPLDWDLKAQHQCHHKHVQTQ